MKLFIFFTSNTIDFFQVRIYWKSMNIISSLFSYLFGEIKLVYSKKLLLANIRSINPIQKYPQITGSYVCILKKLFIIFLLSIIFLIPFETYSTLSKAIKACHIITIHIQSYSMSSYWFMLIKIIYIFSILYHRQI